MAVFSIKSFLCLLSFSKVVSISFNTNCESIARHQVSRTEEYAVELEVDVW